MLTTHTLPKFVRIEHDKPEFHPLLKTLEHMDSDSCGPDWSTTGIAPAGVFESLVDGAAQARFVIVKLPDSAGPYVERLVRAQPSYMTHGWHLGHQRLCIAFELRDMDVSMHVDAHRLVATLIAVRAGRAHLVLAVICGQMLHFRLLSEDLREAYEGEEDSGFHICVFSADNYKPRRAYSEEVLGASVDEFEVRCRLQYDPSPLNFQPLPVRLNDV